MATIREIEQLEQQIQTANSARSKSEGAVEEILRKLKEQFDVSSLEEAESLLAATKAKVAKLSSSLDEAVAEAQSKIKAWSI